LQLPTAAVRMRMRGREIRDAALLFQKVEGLRRIERARFKDDVSAWSREKVTAWPDAPFGRRLENPNSFVFSPCCLGERFSLREVEKMPTVVGRGVAEVAANGATAGRAKTGLPEAAIGANEASYGAILSLRLI